MRLDKFLWCVRLSKTRSIASKACQNNLVLLNDVGTKPSKTVIENDVIAVKSLPIWKTYKVIGFPKSRVGAKLVSDFIIEITSESDLLKLEEVQLNQRYNKSLGLKGRPTKKDRRDLGEFIE